MFQLFFNEFIERIHFKENTPFHYLFSYYNRIREHYICFVLQLTLIIKLQIHFSKTSGFFVFIFSKLYVQLIEN